MAIRGRRTRRGRGRGRSDPPQPPQPCSSPPPPPPPPPSALLSPGVKDDENKWQKQGRVKGLDAFKHQQYLNMAIRGRGTRRGRGRGRSDPPQPSQLCTSPPPLPHTSLSPGVKDDKNKGQKQGRVKGLNAFKHQQKFIAVSSEENDESYDYEDEEMWLIGEKVNQRQLLRQQVADARHDRGRGRSDPSQPSQSRSSPPPPPHTLLSPGIGTIPGVSNNAKMSNATSDSDPHSNDPPANDPTSPPSSGGFHVETDRRKVIFVEAISNPRRFVPQTVTRDIISTVITRMPTPAEKWKNYSVNMQEELFKEFMGKYKFASDYDRNMARTVWERTCMDRYPDQLKNARKKALKQVNSTNLVDTKGHGPKGMRTEVWDGLIDIWLTPKWRKMSDANRSNRAALPDSVLHTAGSISFGEHKRRMEGELKHPISFRDVYDRVHKKKDGEYVSQRSKNFVESYDTIMFEKYGEDSSMHPMVDSEVWMELSDPKKRRVLGGRSLDIGTHGSMATSSSEVIGSSRTVDSTQEAIKDAVNTAMAAFVQTQLVPMLEPILSMIGGSQVRNRVSQAPLQGGVVEEDHEDEDECPLYI